MTSFLIGLFIATLIVALFTMRLYRLILWYSLNSLSLALLAMTIGYNIKDDTMIVSGFLTFLLKASLIPYILKRVSVKFGLSRQIKPNVQIHYSIMLIPALLVFTFYLAEPITNMMASNANYVAISISALFLSLLLMIEHKNIAPKIIGFLTIENSLFLLGTTATDGMPMLIELGIFVDLLMAIVIINLLFHQEENEVAE
ncbi:MAG: hydrogenase [Campylobacteraceae bacterium]|nr:hydrogenase [Campylobacteraceae bacterium]